jgi:tRNA pseudouridine38-40 synthase
LTIDADNGARLGVLLSVQYDGTRFSGFARQPHARTVAGELDGAVRAIDPRASLVRGASRTDAGVHALDQRVAFDTTMDIPSRGWALALARHLCDEMVVARAWRVACGYDPRAHARRKIYRYLVLCSPVRDPFLHDRAFLVRDRLNHDAMIAEARLMLGTHDFRAFRTSTDPRTDTVRTIFRADVRWVDDRLLEIEVEGDRFLHRMVRIIAGTLIDVGRGRLAPCAIQRGIETGMRDVLGTTAPACGLYLAAMELDDEARWTDNWPYQLSTRLT